ncbi:MAG TPA: chemotaxis protein CheW [Methylomusa anaerophila]|uniref:Chemotaxis protein CheW n=1 Tax=Methylomusa anaerophila TaxID=1930071 RepID=A0A348AGD7_9FIRM|nr:chemotaxis protein CheW [Methylomusa anaerophila]BBB90135.1 chemotaxis protein CheW [Methylomusa anaerophila]HML88141.1 chemotaxis protein CheW [Methylomusa anaerophila]
MASTLFVVCELNGEEYGIDAIAVKGILRPQKFPLRKVPGFPKQIEGMINLRGQINYIINLGTKFGLQETKITDDSKFVMLNVGSVIGCIVDEVTDIVSIADEDLQSAPTFLCSTSAKYLKGIGKVEDRMIIILDPEQLLSMEEYEVITASQDIASA